MAETLRLLKVQDLSISDLEIESSCASMGRK